MKEFPKNGVSKLAVGGGGRDTDDGDDDNDLDEDDDGDDDDLDEYDGLTQVRVGR